MTRKHYEAVATIFKKWYDPTSQFKSRVILVMDLVAYFQQENPRFNIQQFYKATGGFNKENDNG